MSDQMAISCIPNVSKCIVVIAVAVVVMAVVVFVCKIQFFITYKCFLQNNFFGGDVLSYLYCSNVLFVMCLPLHKNKHFES